MSIGVMAGLGGGLTLAAAPPNCACHDPLRYPPDPCCGGNGNGCSGNGNGGGGMGGNGGNGGGISPQDGGDGDSCCSNNGGGPFIAPSSGGGNSGSCGCGGNGNGGNGGGGGMGGNGGNGGGLSPQDGDGNRPICLESTYGGGRGSVPTTRGNIRNGARIIPLYNGTPLSGPPTQPPCASPSGTAPAAVPGPSAPFSQAVGVQSTLAPVKFLPVTCAETGATLTSPDCGAVTFYLNDSTLKHYSTPGGTGQECIAHSQPKQFSGGSVQGTPGGTLTITVTG
jgi:hypothetical protein